MRNFQSVLGNQEMRRGCLTKFDFLIDFHQLHFPSYFPPCFPCKILTKQREAFFSLVSFFRSLTAYMNQTEEHRLPGQHVSLPMHLLWSAFLDLSANSASLNYYGSLASTRGRAFDGFRINHHLKSSIYSCLIPQKLCTVTVKRKDFK